MNTDGVKDLAASDTTRKLVLGATVALAAVLILWLLSMNFGPLATVVYVFAFVVFFSLIPLSIMAFGSAVPNAIGKFQIVLGAFAFDHHFLVQRDYGWEWRPGEMKDGQLRVRIDDEWHDVDGEGNLSVLGWRPFGVLRYKDGDTWQAKRADRKATAGDTVPDGGEETVTRGGWTEARAPVKNGRTGEWVLDLKRVYTRGLKKIGDIELIETAEEIIERGQVDSSKLRSFGPLAETIIGIVLGMTCAFLYILIS